ncbi:MAG: response regulator [Planctomycetota bacterium]|jgi:excisionase family DNA binding protein
MDKMKSLFTTGEAAEVCNISQQTIIRCFDSGRLDGFRIPGSRFRRIPRDNLIKFMKDNGIPLDNLNSEKNGKVKVLIVDDDVEIVELMVDVLSRDGRFDIQTAGSGYEAGLKTEQFRPDVIILDYMLPDVNGNIVCKTIKSNPNFESIRIIIVSGVANPEEVQELLDAGATEFIKKPFNIADLVDRILQVVDKEYMAAVH